MAGVPSDEDPSTIRLGEVDAERASRLLLRVITSSGVLNVPLPPGGKVVLGRSAKADVRIDDPSISREHAIVHTSPLAIEDLSSVNGTTLRGRALPPGQRFPVAVGELVELAQVLLLVQPEGALSARGAPKLLSDDRTEMLIERIAQSAISVLILGETGVGKEVMAERIHRLSQRAGRPFLRLNAAALPETLLESELFGHEQGAFTGAMRAKQGLFESAQGGTIFLDEIGELPVALQVKLLRVLEQREVMRVGGLEAIPLDVRFIAATNRELDEAMEQGTFRRDLFYRLNGISVFLPPLRERPDEIERLARSFAPEARWSEETLAWLRGQPWPGNIRELKNAVERAVLLSGGDRITPEHFADVAVGKVGPRPGPTAPPKRVERLKDEVDVLERQRILDALDSCGGNQSRAARLLGISRGKLIARIEEYRLPRPRGRK